MINYHKSDLISRSVMYYVLHTKVLKMYLQCLSIFTLRLLNNNSINVIPEQAFFYHRKIEIL